MKNLNTTTLTAIPVPDKLIQIVKISKTIGVITALIFTGLQIQSFFIDHVRVGLETEYAESSERTNIQYQKVKALRDTLTSEETTLSHYAEALCEKYTALKAWKVSNGEDLKGNANPCNMDF